jgi:hypothetical protein
MPRPIGCQFCHAPLDPAQQFAYHVQALTAADRHPLHGGRKLPHAGGQPLRCCRDCEGLIATGRCEVRDVAPTAAVRRVVSAAVLFGTAAVTVKLGKWVGGL